MKNQEIGRGLASSNLLHDMIVVESELVFFFTVISLHLHEFFKKTLPEKQSYRNPVSAKENCKRTREDKQAKSSGFRKRRRQSRRT